MISFKEYLIELSPSAVAKAKEKFKDEPEADKYVDLFNDLQNKHIITGIDIFSLKFEKLKELVDKKNKQTKTQRNKKFHEFNPDEAKIVFKNNKATVYRILSHEMSCKLGRGTTWCISVKDNPDHWRNFKNYNIYFIITNIPLNMRNFSVSKEMTVEKYAIIVRPEASFDRDKFSVDVIDHIDFYFPIKIDSIWDNSDADIINNNESVVEEFVEENIFPYPKEKWIEQWLDKESNNYEFKDQDDEDHILTKLIDEAETQYNSLVAEKIKEKYQRNEIDMKLLFKRFDIKKEIFK